MVSSYERACCDPSLKICLNVFRHRRLMIDFATELFRVFGLLTDEMPHHPPP